MGGWQSDTISKETDNHNGSEDGHGVFNYRMKFPFVLPCTFPRLRIVAFDFETFSDDVAVAELVLDLGKHFRRLRKEGRITLNE
jgi:hypothetical protein